MTATQLLSKLFESRDQIHYWHLQTKSYAEHKALQGYYEGIIGLIDDFIESYQGRYPYVSGDITVSLTSYQREGQAQAYLKGVLQFLQSDARKIPYAMDSDFNNILDEMQQLTSQTIYLLNMR